MNGRMNEAIRKTLSLSFTLLVHKLTYKKINTHACILVTKCNIIDH